MYQVAGNRGRGDALQWEQVQGRGTTGRSVHLEGAGDEDKDGALLHEGQMSDASASSK